VLLAPPPGPAYNFIVNLYTYPGAWINSFVAAGLIYLQYQKSEVWNPGWRTWLPVTVIFLLCNAFLAIVPFIPPADGDFWAEGYPYYVFPVVGVGVLILGAIYWTLWTKFWPAVRGHRIVAERILGEDGVEVVRYRKVRTHAA
jgi:hypothetical protein